MYIVIIALLFVVFVVCLLFFVFCEVKFETSQNNPHKKTTHVQNATIAVQDWSVEDLRCF